MVVGFTVRLLSNQIPNTCIHIAFPSRPEQIPTPSVYSREVVSCILNNGNLLTETQMLFDYLQASNDSSILARALPLAEREFDFWAINRTLNVTSPFTNKTFEVSRYAVNNTAPRPESYLTGVNLPYCGMSEAGTATYREALLIIPLQPRFNERCWERPVEFVHHHVDARERAKCRCFI